MGASAASNISGPATLIHYLRAPNTYLLRISNGLDLWRQPDCIIRTLGCKIALCLSDSDHMQQVSQDGRTV